MLIAANLAITISLGSVHAMSHPAGAQFGCPRRGQRDPPAPRDPLQRGRRRHRRALPRRGRGPRRRERRRRDGGRRGARHARLRACRSPGLPDPPLLSCSRGGHSGLVDGAMGDGTTLLNPREVEERDYAELYRKGCVGFQTSGNMRRCSSSRRWQAISASMSTEDSARISQVSIRDVLRAPPGVAGHPQPHHVTALRTGNSTHVILFFTHAHWNNASRGIQPAGRPFARTIAAAWPWPCAVGATSAACRALRLHQHRLSHRVDPRQGVRNRGQPGDELRHGVDRRAGTGTEYQPSAAATSAIVRVPRAARLWRAGLAHPAHSRQEGLCHILLVNELEARAGVGDHGTQNRGGAEQLDDRVGKRLAVRGSTE